MAHACSSLVNDSMAQAFWDAGAYVYCGWTNTTYPDCAADIDLFGCLAENMSIQQAFSKLDEEGATACDINGAQFRFYPSDRGDYKLLLTSGVVSLAEAVDNTALTWTTGGSPTEWFRQTAISYYGGDAAQSGDITDGYSTWLQTTVTGPGTLTFCWKVSSEGSSSSWVGDCLRFYVNGVEQTLISGSVDWQQKSYSLTSGTHTLEWRYTKNSYGDSGSDCGWVDKVEFTP